MLLRGFLFSALLFSLQAQGPYNHYQALKDALGLSDAQLAQLQEESPRPNVIRQPMPTGLPAVTPYPAARAGNFRLVSTRFPALVKDGLLDDSQKAKLAVVVEKVWRHPPTPDLATVMELTSAYQWPRHSCPGETGAASGLYLTSSQRSQLQEQRQSAGPSLVAEIDGKDWRRMMLLGPWGRADSPEVAKLTSELPVLRAQAARRRELARGVLDDAQKAKLAEFESALQLVAEAGKLHLLPPLGGGEALCQ